MFPHNGTCLGVLFLGLEQSAAGFSSPSSGGLGALGEAGEVEEGLDGIPFRGRNGGRRGVADAVEVAVGGELVDAAAEGEEAEVGFEAALEAGEGGVVGEQGAEGATGAGEGASEGGGRGEGCGEGGGGEEPRKRDFGG
jgi:hypothetical protein